MASLRDGLGGEELSPSGLQTDLISPYFTGSVTTETQVSGLNLFAAGSVQGARVVEGSTRIAKFGGGAGSPTSYATQMTLFAGSGALSAGSVATIIFTTPFLASPQITISNGSGAMTNSIGIISQSAGSFTVEGTVASKNFNWIAIGN